MLICMRTTLNLNDDLVKRAKQRAVTEHRTLTSVIEDALRRLLAAESPPPQEPYRVPVEKGPQGVRPGIDLDDPRAIRDLLDAEDLERFLRVQQDTEQRATS